jgi:glycolate oxidase FAD binding subunit
MVRDPGRPAMIVPGGVATEVTALAERVRDARARRASLRIVSAGRWLDAGRPCVVAEPLETSGYRGIVHYEPGDLTLTARAGTTLGEIARATHAEGQWLTLDAHGGEEGTIGATIATASAGPLASAYGTPRDHVLGCEFISGTGDVVRAGGRVVKNVAGFDLVRLVTGAWGSIGVITEVTVRLRARPEVDRTMAVRVEDGVGVTAADALAQWLRSSHMTPLAAELLSPSLAKRLGLAGRNLLLRWGGNDAFMRAAEDDAAPLGDAVKADPSVWDALSVAEGEDTIVFRASALPARLGALWARASSLAERAGGFAHATAARGVVRCVIPRASPLSPVALDAELVALAQDVTFVGERMEERHWLSLHRPRVSDALASSVRRAFDPDGVLNPGIIGPA